MGTGCPPSKPAEHAPTTRIPEAVLYTALFAGIFAFWHKSGKRYVTVLSAVLVAVIVLFNVMGFSGAAQAA